MLVVLAFVMLASPAAAHGDGETEEGYLLVQQALGHLAHDASSAGIDLAMEKVDDALATKDQEGVSVPEVEQATSALEAGDVAQARALLQSSIQEAMQNLSPATGSQTGTMVVVPALAGRSGLHPLDWVFLAASNVVLVLGVWLSYLFPADSVRALRVTLNRS